MTRHVTLLAMAGLALGGCALPAAMPAAAPPGAAGAPAKAATARAVGRMAIREAKGYGLKQATGRAVLPFARAHLARVDVYLTNLSSGGEPAFIKQVPPEAFDAPLELVNLKYATSYEVTLKAYQPDDANDPGSLVEAQLDGENGTTFVTGTNELVDLDAQGGIKLVLKDRDFSGRAPGAITITDGALNNPEAPEGLEGAEPPLEPEAP